jgi:molybdate transport system substrate-binding protein
VPTLGRSKTLALIAAILTAFLLLGACGGGGGDSDSDSAAASESGKAPGGGSDDSFTIWANESNKAMLDAIVAKFNKRYPDIEVEAVYGRGRDMTDRLLQGETPDLFLSTANDLAKLAREGSFPDEQVEIGRDPMQIIVPTGNPGRVGDLEVFGFDPSTTTGLCAADAACGRAARAVLANARVNPTPDVTTANTSELVTQLASGQLDAGLLYRSEAVRQRIRGTVEAVQIPSTSNVELVYQIGVGRHGGAADAFTEFVKGEQIKKILQQSGLAPLEGDPQ